MTKEEINEQVTKHANTILGHVYRLTNPAVDVIEALLELRKLDRARIKESQDAKEREAREKQAAAEKVGP